MREAGRAACKESTKGFGWIPALDQEHAEHPCLSCDKATVAGIFAKQCEVVCHVFVYACTYTHTHIYIKKTNMDEQIMSILIFIQYFHVSYQTDGRDGVTSR